MAKKKVVKRNKTRKEVEKKIDEIQNSITSEIYKTLKIIFAVIVFLGIFYLVTVALVDYKSNEADPEEASIQYDEILAGSSFTMRDDEYLVAYYDFNDEELSDLSYAISSYSYSGSKRLYIVDMSNGFNTNYVSDKSNKNVKNVSELAINGPTLILIKDGKVSDYIEGSEKIVDYLS